MLCCPDCVLGVRPFRVTPARPAALVASAVAPPAPAGQRWLDVHCHVFNAADLPVAEFIDHTRLSGIGAIPAYPALEIIAALYQRQIMSAVDELRALTGNVAALPAVSVKATKFDALYALEGRAPPGVPSALAGAVRRTHPMLNGTRLVQDSLNELDPARPAAAPPSDEEHAALAARLQADEDGPANDDYRTWIDLLAQPRNTIVGKLLDQFPADADVMLSPALVDYNRWLGISANQDGKVSSLDDQVAVMAAVSRRRAAPAATTGQRRCVMISFAPFDPWRSIEDDTVLTRMRTWLEEGQAVGAKIYPPMGFAPFGNGDNDVPNASAALRDIVQQKRPGQTVGAALDAELGKLYALCVELDAPVMAHCASSELAEANNALLPGPQHWRKALTAFPQLRANLGHFGGIWSFAPGDDSEAQTKSTSLARRWATDIAVLVHDFANVYADAAFFDLALVDTVAPGSTTAQALEFIANLAQQFPLVPTRLMYASDWIMVAQLTAGNDYARRLMQSMAQIFQDAAAQEDFRWRNAARFLGLGAGDKTRTRLATFLGADSALLSRFDPGQ